MESLLDIYHYNMTKCITFTAMLIINVYLTEIPQKYALRTYFLDLKSHEVFSVFLKMALGLFVLFINVNDSCWFTVDLGDQQTFCSRGF